MKGLIIKQWTRFRLHTVFLEDKAMRERIDTLIDSIPDAQTAFETKIISSYLLAQVEQAFPQQVERGNSLNFSGHSPHRNLVA